MIRKFPFCLLMASALLCQGFSLRPGKPGEVMKRGFPLRKISEETIAFAPGEMLVYNCHYKWGPINADVAKGYVTVKEDTCYGQPAYLCRVYGRSAKFYDAFFKVREDFRGWVTKEGLVPLRFTRDTKEGSYYANDEYVYCREGEPYIKASLSSKTKGSRQMDIPIKPATFDFMALLCQIRNIDFTGIEDNTPFRVAFALDQKVADIDVIFLGREIRHVKKMGRMKTLKFGMQLGEGEQFNDGEDMYMWLSDDENCVPLCFEAPIKVGLVTGYLESWEGLKYPFNPKQ